MSDVDRRRYHSTEPYMLPGYYHHESAVRELVEALADHKHGTCYCDVGIDNPMMRGKHSLACDKTCDLLAHYKELLNE